MRRILLLVITLAGLASAQSGPMNGLFLGSSGYAPPFAPFVLSTDAVADSTLPGHYIYRRPANLYGGESVHVDTLWFEIQEMSGVLRIRSLRILRAGQEVLALRRWAATDSSLWRSLPGCSMGDGDALVWLQDSLCAFGDDSAREANGDTIGLFTYCKERILSHSHSSTSPFNVDTAATLFSGDTVEIDVKSPPPLGPTGVTSRQGMEKRTQAQPGRLYDIRGRLVSGGPTVAGVVIGLCNGSVTRAVDLRAARTGSPNIALERQIGGR